MSSQRARLQTHAFTQTVSFLLSFLFVRTHSQLRLPNPTRNTRCVCANLSEAKVAQEHVPPQSWCESVRLNRRAKGNDE
ncbi:hypothetical protein BZA05DRAFT_186172 [Tricharina praecox]|uniref:uncharacterized protein n=1 Tax=Tricharina praecox TaxID=43433 RepID=UPI0022205616|nr:uncharacterized protein BZA05DRAFT_186172 [Tricharina praecox]KAI5843290.1 hypothetical protein BZA05DRAFT_186172 [Tricharina praecox]